jgi:hypothetical protein
MRKNIFICIFLQVLPILAFCQTSSVKGILTDSSDHANIMYAVVSILKQEDTTLVAFARSDKEGKFQVHNIPGGSYIILISYPKYGDYVEKINLSPGATIDLKNIFLTQKAKLLEEIIVRQAAIRIKGDTTEFTADSFHVRPNATVEDLLKELPGMQVDKNGQITAQGQKVQKVLVDGEEFFSDDPTIATRNIRADAVDKVQVFDKKSDQAEFTGIDDGQKTRTLNLKLKDNAKKGYFGKASAAALDKYYNGQALINAFKAKRKIAAFAIASSTDQTGLNYQDTKSYGFNSDNVQVDGGSGAVIVTLGNDDGFGTQNYYGQGLPESIKAGLHFSNKWNDDKYNANGNYLFNKLAEHTAGNTFTQNILLDSVYYNRENASSHSDKMRNAVSGSMEIQIDSSSSIKITANGYTGTHRGNTEYNSEALSEENKLVNSSIRNTSSDGDNSSLNSSLLWRKKFKKKGRTISINVDEKYNASNSNGFLLNNSNFYSDGIHIIKKDTTDQNKINNALNNVIGAKITYTEPLSKTSFLEFNYSLYNNSSSQKRITYNKDLNSKYSTRVDSLSSDFKYIYNTNSAGINYRYNAKKFNFSIGGNVANTAFEQTDLVKDTVNKYNYYNFFPRTVFNYKFSAFSNLYIAYNGSTTQPTIDQLQPLRDNMDPLNVVIGNPSLKQQFQNSFNLNYSNFQLINERFLYLGSSFSFTKDQISNSYTIDALGRRVSRFVNLNGNYTGRLFGGISLKIPKTNMRFGLSPDVTISKYANIVNGVQNSTNSTNLAATVELKINKKDAYEFTIGATPSYNKSQSSISTVANTHYWSYEYILDGNYLLPWKLEIGSDVNFKIRQKLNAYDVNNNVILWNAYLEKKLMKNDVLALRVSINDILDQNKGYDRIIQPYAIQEKHYLTFQRYGLITVTYNFSNKGAAAQPKGMSITL